MKKLQFKTDINRPAAEVYNTMLNKETFLQWTTEFNPTPGSTNDVEGDWKKGSKMLFVGTNEEGKRQGMVSRIEENIPNKFVSIYHYGILDGDQEIVEGPAVDEWGGGYENYHFEEHDGATTVTVEMDAAEEHAGYFSATWPKALAKLKAMCELSVV